MKFLLMGEGFIGGKLKEVLEQKGHEVDVFDIIYGHDLRNREQVIQEVGKKEYDTVILMAAVANLNHFDKDPLLGMDVNVGGTVNVAHACMLHKTRLVFISTCCAYGNTPDLPSNEEAKVLPTEVYAASKLAGEWIIKGYHESYDLDYVVLRIATCYGPGMRAALAPAVFINQVNKGEPITIHGNGRQTRTLTYIDDNVAGIVTMVTSGVVNETFNISSEEETSVNKLADVIRKEMGKPNHEIKHVPDRKGQTIVEQIDTGKAREVRLWKGRYAPTAVKADKVVSWKAKVSLNQGIKKTLEWMKDNGIRELK